MPQQEVIPNSYWQAVKDKLGEYAAVPGNLIRGQMGSIAQGAVMNPNARNDVPTEALPGGAMDPIVRQQLIQSILQRQGGQMPAQAADQRQLLIQEAQRRGIPIPPDSPLMQPVPQQPRPDNPAGIQF